MDIAVVARSMLPCGYTTSYKVAVIGGITSRKLRLYNEYFLIVRVIDCRVLDSCLMFHATDASNRFAK